MERTGIQYSTYVQILKEELVPAMGCTEPIALAYCAAKAREVLGCLPERCVVEGSPAPLWLSPRNRPERCWAAFQNAVWWKPAAI